MSPKDHEKEEPRLEADGSRLMHRLRSETDALKRDSLRRELEELIQRAQKAAKEGRELGARISEWMSAIEHAVETKRARQSEP